MSYGACYICGRKYGDEYGFPDLIIPDDMWLKISPKNSEGGLLCPSCICKLLYDKNLKCSGEFASGPLCFKKEFSIGDIVKINKLNLENEILLTDNLYGFVVEITSEEYTICVPYEHKIKNNIVKRLTRYSVKKEYVASNINKKNNNFSFQ